MIVCIQTMTLCYGRRVPMCTLQSNIAQTHTYSQTLNDFYFDSIISFLYRHDYCTVVQCINNIILLSRPCHDYNTRTLVWYREFESVININFNVICIVKLDDSIKLVIH